MKRWALGAVMVWVGVTGWAGERPNVLMLLVDDLKPAMGCYGDSVARTPNLDRLAARGARFELAYCNQAVCAPSRFNLMLGSRSSSTGLYGLGSPLRKIVPDAVTLPQYFHRYEYRTESMGKVFHIGHGNLGDPESFEVPHFHDKVIEYLESASTQGGQMTREEAYFSNQMLDRIGSLPRGAAYEHPEVEDEAYADGRVTAEAIRRLRAAKSRLEQGGEPPFFMAVGLARPHLPFSVPKKYWDLYDPTKLPMPEFTEGPQGAPAYAVKRRGEISNYFPVPERGDPEGDTVRELIHGYYAGVSFADAQVGKILDELDALNLSEKTIVVLWGDHGFHLGDLGIWTKHTNYEQANRIPLMIVAPGVTKPGSVALKIAETVDIYPTLVELAGLPCWNVPQPMDGESLVTALSDPCKGARGHAYHVFPRGGRMGRAIRTERYRLVEWRKANAGEKDDVEFELYDYQEDPLERKNLAKDRPETVEELRAILAQHPAVK